MSKKLRLKGLRVPRIFIWMLGFSHGCIFRTAMVDPENGLISSGYITEKRRLFNELSAQHVKIMEEELRELRKEAAGIMADEAFLRLGMDGIQRPGSTETIAERRAVRRAENDMNIYRNGHRTVIDRLADISREITSYETSVREELDATASALQGLFAVYGRGMLVRPVRESMIPPVGYENSFDIYHRAHEKEDLQMDLILREVYGNEKE